MCRGSLAWLGRQTHNLECKRGHRPMPRSRGLESRPRHQFLLNRQATLIYTLARKQAQIVQLKAGIEVHLGELWLLLKLAIICDSRFFSLISRFLLSVSELVCNSIAPNATNPIQESNPKKVIAHSSTASFSSF